MTPRFARNTLGPDLLRYGGGSLVMLGVKIGLMQAMLIVLSELPAYAVVQIMVFLISYWLHSRITFRTRLGWSSLGRYFRTMAAFQLLDWVLFSIIFTRFGIQSTLIILLSTVLVFVLRFLFVRHSLRGAPA